MKLKSLKSSEKMKKAHKSKEKSTKNANIFCRNKPNLSEDKYGAKRFSTRIYEILPAWRAEKTNPNKPNSRDGKICLKLFYNK